jgi:uncharacterized membrane protein YGL010W
MRSLLDQLSNYAAYHRDRRNIATHFVGIPMIVFGIAALTSRPFWSVGPVQLSLAALLVLGSIVFYIALDLRFGLAMAAFMGSAGLFGAWIAAQSFGAWLSAGLVLFVGGWIIQFVGHIYEGRKPAFVDDLIGLLIGPLFIVAEAAFALGMRPTLLHAIEARVGPTRSARPPAGSPEFLNR